LEEDRLDFGDYEYKPTNKQASISLSTILSKLLNKTKTIPHLDRK